MKQSCGLIYLLNMHFLGPQNYNFDGGLPQWKGCDPALIPSLPPRMAALHERCSVPFDVICYHLLESFSLHLLFFWKILSVCTEFMICQLLLIVCNSAAVLDMTGRDYFKKL